MPSLSDFLWAPWKILTVLGSSGAILPTGQISRAPVSAGLCRTENVGGQILSTCTVAGYEMPTFIFYASAFIFGLFVFASIKLTRQCRAIATSLESLNREIDRVFGPNKGKITPKELNRLRELMSPDPLTAHAWNRFEEALMTAGQPPEIYTTEPIDSIFTKAILIEEHISTQFYSSLPGVLTGLGLLMTFVAILDGLSHVTVTANMDVQGIAGLINGLSGKFVSSITAVTCAVSLVFVERRAYSRPEKAYREFLHKIGSRVRRRTAESILHSIELQLTQQGLALLDLAKHKPAHHASRVEGE